MNQRGKSALTYKQTKIYQQYKITGAAGVITYLKHDIHTYIIYKPQHPTTTKLSPFNSGFSSIIIASAKSYDTKQQIIITSVNRHFYASLWVILYSIKRRQLVIDPKFFAIHPIHWVLL